MEPILLCKRSSVLEQDPTQDEEFCDRAEITVTRIVQGARFRPFYQSTCPAPLTHTLSEI